MSMLRDLSRTIGLRICALRGHRFFYPNGCFDSWHAYSCVRCGALSRSLDSLPCAPEDEPFMGFDDEEAVEREFALASRWFRLLPLPRWL